MPHHLFHRCTLVMLLALSLGLVAALWGWGPIGLPKAAVFQEGAPLFFQAPMGAVVALTALAVWVQFLLARGQRRVCDVTWPWRILLVFIALRASLWAAQNSATTDAHLTAIALGIQLSQAGLAVLLCWGWLAERFSAFRSVQVALLACATSLAVAVLWWYFIPSSNATSPSGDVRIILLLQLQPLAILLAGVLRLPGRLLGRSESMWMAAAYLLTWLMTWWPAVTTAQAALPLGSLPWLLFSLLCFMVFILMNSGLRIQRNPARAGVRSDRRGTAPAWLTHFRFDALATSNRRSNS